MSANPIEHAALLTIFTSPSEGPRSVADMPRGWPVSRALRRLQLTAPGWMKAAELARVGA